MVRPPPEIKEPKAKRAKPKPKVRKRFGIVTRYTYTVTTATGGKRLYSTSRTIWYATAKNRRDAWDAKSGVFATFGRDVQRTLVERD